MFITTQNSPSLVYLSFTEYTLMYWDSLLMFPKEIFLFVFLNEDNDSQTERRKRAFALPIIKNLYSKVTPQTLLVGFHFNQVYLKLTHDHTILWYHDLATTEFYCNCFIVQDTYINANPSMNYIWYGPKMTLKMNIIILL